MVHTKRASTSVRNGIGCLQDSVRLCTPCMHCASRLLSRSSLCAADPIPDLEKEEHETKKEKEKEEQKKAKKRKQLCRAHPPTHAHSLLRSMTCKALS